MGFVNWDFFFFLGILCVCIRMVCNGGHNNDNNDNSNGNNNDNNVNNNVNNVNNNNNNI